MSDYRLVPYDLSLAAAWDGAVDGARNRHFIFRRAYMEYHADRFTDNSYLLLRGSDTVALLPAHRDGDVLASHRGLSFGGWILAPGCLHQDLQAGFDLLGREIRLRGLRQLTYSPSPYPYHAAPCGDDEFLLAKIGARHEQVKLPLFLGLGHGPRKTSRRARRGEQASPGDIRETDDVERFWGYLVPFLADRYQGAPVHSAEEMRLLKNRFPREIRLVVISQKDRWTAGGVLFLSRQVQRYQYSFRDLEAKGGHLKYRLHDWTIRHPEMRRPWIDFSTSMDPATGELMPSLLGFKESMGARGVPLNTWTWEP